MYDNVDMRLNKEDAGNIDLLAEIPAKMENPTVIYPYYSEYPSITGYLGSLKVNVTENRLVIKDSSLCKWFLGDNFQTLTRGDVKQAIQRMSDELYLPMYKANITRIDLAQNFIMDFDLPVYFNHLGQLVDYKRLEQPKGLYYNQIKKLLIFYDKVAEQKHKKNPIPEIYQNRHVLRYEMRFFKGLLHQFNLPEIKAETLYNEVFYMDIIKRWHNEYKRINKIRDNTNIDFTMIKTKRQLSLQGLSFLIQSKGGELAFIKEIAEAQSTGQLTKKQAFDLRDLVNEASRSEILTCSSDVISELDKKVNEAVRFYR